MQLQYRISLCWEQQRGRDRELMVDRATLLHSGFSTPSEEGGYIKKICCASIFETRTVARGNKPRMVARRPVQISRQYIGPSAPLVDTLANQDDRCVQMRSRLRACC